MVAGLAAPPAYLVLAALIAWAVRGQAMAPLAWAGTGLAALGVAAARPATPG